MEMVDPKKLAKLHKPAKELDNDTRWRRVAYWFGETKLWCLGTNGLNAYTQDEIDHVAPDKVRRIGHRVMAFLAITTAAATAGGTYAYLQSDQYKGLATICDVSPQTQDYKPEYGTNWDPAVGQVSGTLDSQLCYAAVKNNLGAQYGKPAYGTTYQIPVYAHEIKVSTSTTTQVQVTTVPGTTPQN